MVVAVLILSIAIVGSVVPAMLPVHLRIYDGEIWSVCINGIG